MHVRRVIPLLLRAGANIYSPEIRPARANFCSYVRRVNGAGGFHAYEKEHLAALVATFAPKFSHLPEEVVGVVMMFYAHVGFYSRTGQYYGTPSIRHLGFY